MGGKSNPLCSNQVTLVSLSEMNEDSDTNDDEGENQDLGLGSINEVDPEGSLQMVPFHITQEVAPPLGGLDESMLHRDRGEDILTTVRVFSCFDCPPIPLCRLIPHARVRGLRSDVIGLIAAFAREGYIKEKGAFIVSLRTCQLVDSNVTGTNNSSLL